MRTLLALLLLVASVAASAAETTTRMPIYLRFDGEDAVGIRLAYRIREELAASRSLRRVNDISEAFMVVALNTMVLKPTDPTWSQYSIIFNVNDFRTEGFTYRTNTLGTMADEHVDAFAKDIVAKVSAEAEQARTEMKVAMSQWANDTVRTCAALAEQARKKQIY